MMITLGVAPEKEGEFNEFYHHRFLPGLLACAPEVLRITRFQELNISGSLRWYTKQFLTIYEFENEADIAKSDEIFKRQGISELVTEFQSWKTNDLRNFSRVNYLPRWQHERGSEDSDFGLRPFLLWAHEMKPEFDDSFQDWYENDYLPMQIADIPGWTSCRRYSSVGKEPIRHLTFFESQDEASLMRSFDDLRALHRTTQNREWKRRVEAGVTWHDATSFRCIYRRPG